MFSVIYYDKANNAYINKVMVFNIRNDKNGYPYFLIYYEGQWKYVSAKYCVPLTE